MRMIKNNKKNFYTTQAFSTAPVINETKRSDIKVNTKTRKTQKFEKLGPVLKTN